jgi:hypothetical protein
MLRTIRLALALLVLFASASAACAAFSPWDPLVTAAAPNYESWIYFGGSDPKLTMHTANAGDYGVGFDVARRNKSGQVTGARGMNALKFLYGGSDTGHLVSNSLTGSFAVENTGDSRTFADLLLLVAIDAPSLPAGFALSLGVQGQAPYVFNAATDFGFYDPTASGYDAGRPSGYYSATLTSESPLAYSFTSGIVSLWGAPGVNLGPLGSSVTFDYAFTHLPGTAVFSVYGYDADIGWVYHTNRDVADGNDPGAALSTFEVAPEPGTLVLVAFGLAAAWKGRSRCVRR